MQATDTASEVLAVISDYLGEPIAPQDVLADKGCDSIDIVEIAIDLEGEFDVEINDEQLESVRTAQDLIALVLAAKP